MPEQEGGSQTSSPAIRRAAVLPAVPGDPGAALGPRGAAAAASGTATAQQLAAPAPMAPIAETAAATRTGTASATRSRPEGRAGARPRTRSRGAGARAASAWGAASVVEPSTSRTGAAAAAAGGDEPPNGRPNKPLLAAAAIAGTVLIGAPFLLLGVGNDDERNEASIQQVPVGGAVVETLEPQDDNGDGGGEAKQAPPVGDTVLGEDPAAAADQPGDDYTAAQPSSKPSLKPSLPGVAEDGTQQVRKPGTEERPSVVARPETESPKKPATDPANDRDRPAGPETQPERTADTPAKPAAKPATEPEARDEEPAKSARKAPAPVTEVKDSEPAPKADPQDKAEPAAERKAPKQTEPEKAEPENEAPKKAEPRKAPKTEAPQPEEAPKKEEPQKEAPKEDAPKKEEPKPEEPKPEEPKKEEPKKEEAPKEAPATRQGGALPQSANFASVGNVQLKNAMTGMCADVPGYDKGAVDGPVNQFDCNPTGADNQLWDFTVAAPGAGPNGADLFTIRNGKDGLCLDLPDFGGKPAGTNVSQFHCRPGSADNQLWYLEKKSDGKFWIRNYSSEGRCLDVSGYDGSGGRDSRLTIFDCNLRDDHLWSFS